MSEAVRIALWQPPDLAPPEPPPSAKPGPSVAELERIQQAAREEGFTRGYADGLAQGQAEVRRHVAQLAGLIDSFARPLAHLDHEVEHALGTLALRIARALVGEAYKADPGLLADLVADAVALAGQGVRAAEVRMHPDDLDAIEPMLALAEMPLTRLTADPGLARGDVRVLTEALRVDATLDTRLQAVMERMSRERGA